MFFYDRIERSYIKQIDASGLAFFRIAYSLVFLAELIQLFYFRHLIFDNIPYLEAGPVDPTIPMLLWMCSVVFILLGVFTRTAALVNFIFSLVYIGSITSYEYHMFYAYMGINFLLIFLPVARSYSFDRLRLKLKYSNTHFEYSPASTVSPLTYYLPVLLGVGFVYFDSILFKLTSPLWMHGLGMWEPASLPMLTHVNMSFLMNAEWVVKFLGYLTLVFEFVFIFLFWFKKFRLPLAIIGIGLHIGILIEFPIPWFALGVCSLYLLLIPVKYWKSKKDIKKPAVLKIYYDDECPLCIRTKIVIEHFDLSRKIECLSVQQYAGTEQALQGIDQAFLFEEMYGVSNRGNIFKGFDTYIQVFNTIWYLKPIGWILRLPGINKLGKNIYKTVAGNRVVERCTDDNCGYTPPVLQPDASRMKIFKNRSFRDVRVFIWYISIWILVILQVNVSYNSGLVTRVRNNLGIDNTAVGKSIAFVSRNVKILSGTVLGITNHPVFMDFHFKNYNHIITIVYKKTGEKDQYLPIIDKNGMPGFFIYGPNWVKWTFRTDAPDIDQNVLIEGIRSFTAFWAHKNNVSLNLAVFEIRVKKIDSPNGWEYDFLNRQISHPWIKAGEVRWENEKFNAYIPIIESL